MNRKGRIHLLLDQFEFFSLEQLLWDALGIGLGTETQMPKLLAEFGRIFIKKSSKLNLEDFDVGLRIVVVSTGNDFGCIG